MKFDFSFGKKSKTITQWAIITIALTSLVSGLHKCTGISEVKLWELIGEIQRKLTKKGVSVPSELNDYIIKTPEHLNRRIIRDTDSAINDYEREERRLYKPNMTNKNILKEIEKPKYTEAQRQIIKDAVYYECPSGAIGIHAVWYDSKECNY
jgi:hypothetical protein